ncbi:MAG: cytochrome c [Sulfurimonas sp.]|nr:cytochrome c [Sulfurimonas sp.]
MKKILLTLTLTILTLNADIENGKDVYAQNCGNCHRIDMKGGDGKDFNIVSYTRKKEDVIKYVTNPAKTFKEFGYNANAMPKLPLSKQEIKDVSEYIDSLQKFKKWMIK